MQVDDQIIEDCIVGKRSAQKKLYETYAPRMLSVCMRYCRKREEAEDVMIEGFLKVFQNIHTYRREGVFEGWMRRIMVNHALNYIRKQQKLSGQLHIEEINETEIVREDEPFEFPEGLSPDKIMKMIQTLPDGYRMVFNLYVFEGHNHNEIGQILGISENTSKTQLMKARRWLRKRLD